MLVYLADLQVSMLKCFSINHPAHGLVVRASTS